MPHHVDDCTVGTIFFPVFSLESSVSPSFSLSFGAGPKVSFYAIERLSRTRIAGNLCSVKYVMRP